MRVAVMMEINRREEEEEVAVVVVVRVLVGRRAAVRVENGSQVEFFLFFFFSFSTLLLFHHPWFPHFFFLLLFPHSHSFSSFSHPGGGCSFPFSFDSLFFVFSFFLFSSPSSSWIILRIFPVEEIKTMCEEEKRRQKNKK